jgi:enolase
MSDTRIERIRGRRVWDSRGRPTVEAEVHLRNGVCGRAIAPAGASMGTGEALDLRDGGLRFAGMGVGKACATINDVIAKDLAGRDIADQQELDDRLVALDGTPDRSRLGGNAMVATSMALAHAGAAAAGRPLWLHLAGERTVRMPLPEIQIFGGGAHAARRVDVQDFMIMCPSAHSFAQALEWTAEVYLAAGALLKKAGTLQGVADEGGYWPAFSSNEQALDTLMQAIVDAGLKPGEQVGISLDIAASEFGRNGRYELALESRTLDSDAMIDMLGGWVDRYPILSIEDPLAEDDPNGFQRFCDAYGSRCQVIGDDFLVTNADRVRVAAETGSVNAVLIKPNQAGTLSEAHAALQAGKKAGFSTIVSARSGETEDVTIAHLAVGWDAGQLKVGSFSRSERMAKWNEVLRIEESLGSDAHYWGWDALPFRRKGSMT